MIVTVLVSVALAAPVGVDEVVASALARDPALAEAEGAVVAATGAWKAATGLRHDPSLEVRVGLGLPQHEAALTQPLSLTGEGVAAARSASAALRAAEADRDRRRLVVAAEARRALILAIRAEAERARTEEVLALASELRAAAERRLATGDAAELEVHLARLEESAAAADHVTALREALAVREDLAARAGIPLDAELPDDPFTAAPSAADGAERADLAAADARVESARAAVRRERAGALPPVEIGVWAQAQDVDVTPGGGGVDVAPWSWSENVAWTVGPTVGLTLPLWSGNREGIARAAGDLELAAAEREALGARVEAEQAGAAERREAMGHVDGTPEPTTEARAALAGVDAAFAAGEIGAADAALLRARVLDAWGRAARVRADAALVAVDLALAESWPTLLPAP